ncbi:YbfB/YjiJ family MFS transporter [Geomonas sp.]|uniref:YbfB/YjiJ family MFS transporter n=1 Tax=Geomonas sp. TaxID=2651584 RepID=UPI002B49C332|nr:YbfB/YjiJ family MFS transporter [Geomonas sp.]HJV34268.1 YbfB/YjiJ family MFS transporter [Geomonas sp.]
MTEQIAPGGIKSGVAAGFIALMVAMGIGRFLYTPLLPLMLIEYGLRADQAGLLASLNFIGYLAGAFCAGHLCHRYGEYRVLAAGLIFSTATTAATGLFTTFSLVALARLIAGTASGLAFVAVSGLVLLIIARDGRENLTGLYYGGVGGGIVLTGLAALPTAHLFGAGGAWILFGGLSALLSAVVLLLLRRHAEPSHADVPVKHPFPRQPRFLRLVIAYGLEGFGYIITGTFMVAAALATVGPSGAHLAWVVAGCAALPSAFLWSIAARRWGRLKPLMAAFFLQAAGILLPAALPGALPVVTGALLFGATFMGIVNLALSDGASYLPGARSRIVGLMTGVYGVGQILGPALAGYFSARTGNFRLALMIAAVTVVAAGALLIPDAFRPPLPEQKPPR